MFSPYQSKRAFEEIAEQIKESILSRRLITGDRLPPERSLAKQFQVGRLTIREALRTLESKGLINIKKGSTGGAFVGASSPDALPSTILDSLQLEGLTGTQITEARITLERGIVKAVIDRGTTEDLARIEESIEESKTVREPDQAVEVISKMIEFHILLGEATHNLAYIMFIRALMEWGRRKRLHWIPSQEEQHYSYQSHKSIWVSIKDKDIVSAQELMTRHIRYMGMIGNRMEMQQGTVS